MGIFKNAFTVQQYVVDAIFELAFEELDAVHDKIMLGRCVLYKIEDTYGIAMKVYDDVTRQLKYKALNIQPSDWVGNDIISLDGGEIE